MYKGIITTPTRVPANTDIPFVTEFNTNNKTSPKNGVVSILDDGLWETNAELTLTDVGTEITANFFVNGVVAPEVSDVTTAADTEVFTLNLTDKFRVLRANYPELANVSVRLNVEATVNNGVFTVGNLR